MLEITRLHEITYDDFKKTIDNALNNKHFIRNSIQQNINSNLTIPEQLGSINGLMFYSNKNYVLIKTIGNIEWTPTKLYDTAYYMVNMYSKFWLISHNSYDGFSIKYNITIKEYLYFIFKVIKNTNVESISQVFYPSNHELYYSFHHLETNQLQYVLIKQMQFPDLKNKVNHYLLKVDGKVYYFPISTINVYKPILYAMSLSN